MRVKNKEPHLLHVLHHFFLPFLLICAVTLAIELDDMLHVAKLFLVLFVLFRRYFGWLIVA